MAAVTRMPAVVRIELPFAERLLLVLRIVSPFLSASEREALRMLEQRVKEAQARGEA